MGTQIGKIYGKKGGTSTKIIKNKKEIKNVRQINIGEGSIHEYTVYGGYTTLDSYEEGLAANAYVFDHYMFFVYKDGSTSHEYKIYDLNNQGNYPSNYMIDGGAVMIAGACYSSYASKTTVPSPNSNAFYIHFLVHNDELYALGGVTKSNTSSAVNTFKKYNPSTNTWTSLTNIPISFSTGVEVSAPSGIHIFQGTNQYVWNGSSWTKLASLPSSVTVSNSYSSCYGDKTYDAFVQFDFKGDATSALGTDMEVIVVCKNTSTYSQAYCYYANGTSGTTTSFADKMVIQGKQTKNNTFYCGGSYRRSLSAGGTFVSFATGNPTSQNALVIASGMRARASTNSPIHYNSSSNYGYLVCYKNVIYKAGLVQSDESNKYYWDCYAVATTQLIDLEN